MNHLANSAFLAQQSRIALCIACVAALAACSTPMPTSAPAAPATVASAAPTAAARPAATASTAVAVRETIPAECLEQRAPTGSNMVRRDRACVALTEEERAAARRELEEMRAQQGLKDANRMGGAGR